MKIIILNLLFIISASKIIAQNQSSFKINGDANTFYPVEFPDVNHQSNLPTSLHIGRWYQNWDATGRGSLLSSFIYHTNNWGDGAEFVNANLTQNQNGPYVQTVVNINFIAGWVDPTYDNASNFIIIWLLGNTAYYTNCSQPISPVVNDGVQNTLPITVKGQYSSHVYVKKTTVDPYVNSSGTSCDQTIYITAQGKSYFAGDRT